MSLVVIVVVVVSLFWALVGSRLATRVGTWTSLVLLVGASCTASTTTARIAISIAAWIPVVALTVITVIAVIVAIVVLATLHNRLDGLLLRVEVRVKDLHELFLVFFLHRLHSLDLLGDCITFAFVPDFLQSVEIESGFGELATEVYSATTT